MPENNLIISNIKRNIDPKELFCEFLNRWYIFAVSIILAVLIALLYSLLFLTPMYSSTAKMIIINKQEYSTLGEMELSASSMLAKDFSEIINDKLVLTDVAKKLDNKYTASQLKSYITVNNPLSTRIIEVTVLSPDAKDSKKIADSICAVSQEKLVELMGLDRITVISNGDVAKSPSNPNTGKNVVLGILLGSIIGLSAIVLIYLTSNKINSPEDIEKYINVSVLSVIPYNNKLTNKSSK